MMQPFDRAAEDVGNVVHLEHVNLTVPDQVMATRFYVTALGLTRDPYLNTGAEVMWINAGTTQFHLPHGPAQRLRGRVDLVIPGLQFLTSRLHAAMSSLAGTQFAFAEHPDFVDVVCPWGNRLRCFEPDGDRFGPVGLGIVQVVLDVPMGCAPGIAQFYRDVFGASAEVGADPGGAPAAHVRVGVGQNIVDLQTGARCYQLEHEVRSMTNPLFRRPLVNRNPAQTTRNYRPGADQFTPWR